MVYWPCFTSLAYHDRVYWPCLASLAMFYIIGLPGHGLLAMLLVPLHDLYARGEHDTVCYVMNILAKCLYASVFFCQIHSVLALPTNLIE